MVLRFAIRDNEIAKCDNAIWEWNSIIAIRDSQNRGIVESNCIIESYFQITILESNIANRNLGIEYCESQSWNPNMRFLKCNSWNAIHKTRIAKWNPKNTNRKIAFQSWNHNSCFAIHVLRFVFCNSRLVFRDSWIPFHHCNSNIAIRDSNSRNSILNRIINIPIFAHLWQNPRNRDSAWSCIKSWFVMICKIIVILTESCDSHDFGENHEWWQNRTNP